MGDNDTVLVVAGYQNIDTARREFLAAAARRRGGHVHLLPLGHDEKALHLRHAVEDLAHGAAG